jgi:hypothetical protein
MSRCQNATERHLLSRILSNAGLIFANDSCTLFLQSAAFFSGSARRSPPEQPWIAVIWLIHGLRLIPKFGICP